MSNAGVYIINNKHGGTKHVRPSSQQVADIMASTVDDTNPALPGISNIRLFPEFRVLEVMQDLYHQTYVDTASPGSRACWLICVCPTIGA